MSYVYFIKPVGMDGPIKIGFSAVPEKRLMAFSIWSPFPLELMGAVSGGSSEEAFLHKRFAQLHSHREWFRSSPLLRQTIARILSGESIKDACAEIPEVGAIKNQARRAPTPERALFYEYGKRFRRVTQKYCKEGSWRLPPDAKKIMDDWAGEWGRRDPITPSPAQIARLEEVATDFEKHGIFRSWDEARAIVGAA